MWGVHFNLANLRCIEVIKSQRYEGSIRQRFLVNVAALRAVISVKPDAPPAAAELWMCLLQHNLLSHTTLHQLLSAVAPL